MMYSDETILKYFNMIDQGESNNIVFNNVVMLHKTDYIDLLDQIDSLEDQLQTKPK